MSGPSGDDDGAPWDPDAVIEVEIGDELDLHAFHPRDVKSVVEEYLHAAAEKGFTEVRVVHGKGVGTLRTIVHEVLATHPDVAAHRPAEERRGSWGATIVVLKPRPVPPKA